ncbi:MAG: glycosyltransferase family 4 protein [Bryobacteraceae bacterium]
MRILTNFERFEPEWRLPDGASGTARMERTFAGFRRHLSEADLLLINCDVGLVYRLCCYFLLFPAKRKPIVAVDLVLRKPRNRAARLAAAAKRRLLARVDHFIHYFRDLNGYAQWYGIGAGRSSFVGFKPNLRYRYEPRVDAPEGEYVLCFGRSQRDYDTFLEAISGLGYPAAIPRPDFAALRAHDSRFTWPLERMPSNVRILEDDGSQEAMVRAIEGARIVALPLLSSTLAASGISVYLNAMLLNKPVVISAGPGVSDVLTGEARIVPPENPGALAEAIARLWTDDAQRRAIAAAGQRYARSLGGEPELRQRVLAAAIQWFGAR